jgi:hypothetical protein
MTNDEKLAKIAAFVKQNFSQRTADSYDKISQDANWTVNDACGGNMDDAYQLGMSHGEANVLDYINYVLNTNTKTIFEV